MAKIPFLFTLSQRKQKRERTVQKWIRIYIALKYTLQTKNFITASHNISNFEMVHQINSNVKSLFQLLCI